MIGENPLFAATESAERLRYGNPEAAVRQHCRKVREMRTVGKDGKCRMKRFIPESDLYRLISRSNIPETEAFQDWICEELIPSIRRMGMCFSRMNVDKSNGPCRPLSRKEIRDMARAIVR